MSERVGGLDLDGATVILMGAGTIEILRSMQAALIDLGATVFCRFGQDPFETIDRTVDMLFCLELASLGPERIDLLRRALDRLSPEAPMVNIALSHPIPTAASMGFSSLEEIDRFLRDRRIVTWSMCQASRDEFTAFGLPGGVFQPFGVYPHVYLDQAGVFTSERWVDRNSGETTLPYGEVHRLFHAEMPEDIRGAVPGKAVFLGVPTLEFEKQLPVHQGAAIDMLRRAFVPNSKGHYAEMLGHRMVPGETGAFIRFHYDWIVNVPLQRRRIMAIELVHRFGERVGFFGDGWDGFLPRSFPTSLTARLYYAEAACCLDFGSLQFDGPLYPRTAEILKCGGLLLSGAALGLSDTVSGNQFKNIDQLSALIERAFDPEERVKMLNRQGETLAKYSFASILPVLCADVLEATG